MKIKLNLFPEEKTIKESLFSLLQYLGDKSEAVIYIIFFIVLLISGFNKALYPGYIVWGDDLQWQSWIYRIGYGEVPFRDFHQIYGIILPYLFLLPFKLLGGDYFAWSLIRYLGLPFFSLLSAILVSRLVFKTPLFRILFLVTASILDQWGLFFAQPWDFRFWIGLFTLVILFSKLKHRFFRTGVWVAFVFFSSVDQGVYLLGSLGVLGVLGARSLKLPKMLRLLKFGTDRRIWEFGKGLGLMVCILTFIMLIIGALKPYLEFSLLKASVVEFSMGGLVFPDFPFDKLNSGIYSFLTSWELRYYLVPLIYVISLLAVIHKNIVEKKIHWKIVFLIIYGIFSFRTTLGRSDFGHLLLASCAAVILSVWLLEQIYLYLFGSFKKRRLGFLDIFKIVTSAVFLLGGVILLFLMRSPFEKGFLAILTPNELSTEKYRQTLVYNPTLRVYLSPDRSENIEGAIQYLSENAQNKFYAYELMGGMNFLTGSRNITRFDQDSWASIDDQKNIIKTLEDKHNNYVVKPVQNYLLRGSLLDDYFNKYYSFNQKFGEIIIATRSSIPFDPDFLGDMGLVKKINDSWSEVEKNTYELSFQSTEINKIKMAIKLSYLPLMKLIAKTQAKIEVYTISDTINAYDSDTPFMAPYSSDGQLIFHLNANVTASKIRFIISSPGGFNPVPLSIKIENTWLYR